MNKKSIDDINSFEQQINEYYSLKFYTKIEGCISFFSEGTYNWNYIYNFGINQYILRVNKASQIYKQQEEQILYEYNTLRDLQASEVTPKAIDIIPVFIHNKKFYVLVESFISGHGLNYAKDSQKVAFSISRVHQSKPLYNKYIGVSNAAEILFRDAWKKLNYLNDIGVDNECIKLLTHYGKELDCTKWKYKRYDVINNTDLNASNFIIHNNKCFIVDWECGRLSNFSWDLAHFIAVTTTIWDKKNRYLFNNETEYEFIRCYCEEMNFKDIDDVYNSVKQLKKYIYLRCFTWYQEYIRLTDLAENVKYTVSEYCDLEFIENTFLE